jgi:hypothetical protein
VWISDDPVVVRDQEEVLHRRVLRIPNYIGIDVDTGRRVPLAGALQVDVGSGMSVSLESKLTLSGCTLSDLHDPARECLISFLAATARRARNWGTIYKPEPGEKRGLAHGLVRNREQRPTKADKRALRDEILKSFQWSCSSLSWLSVAVWEILVAVVRGFGLLGGTNRGVGSLA